MARSDASSANGLSLTSSPRLSGEIPYRVGILGFVIACSRGRNAPRVLSNRRTTGCANQPLLLSGDGFGVIAFRMFLALFTSAFATVPHDSQTYRPRSTRCLSAFIPQTEHVFEVSCSETLSNSILRSRAM